MSGFVLRDEEDIVEEITDGSKPLKVPWLPPLVAEVVVIVVDLEHKAPRPCPFIMPLLLKPLSVKPFSDPNSEGEVNKPLL